MYRCNNHPTPYQRSIVFFLLNSFVHFSKSIKKIALRAEIFQMHETIETIPNIRQIPLKIYKFQNKWGFFNPAEGRQFFKLKCYETLKKMFSRLPQEIFWDIWLLNPPPPCFFQIWNKKGNFSRNWVDGQGRTGLFRYDQLVKYIPFTTSVVKYPRFRSSLQNLIFQN